MARTKAAVKATTSTTSKARRPVSPPISKSRTVPKTLTEVRKGDVIAEHPDHPGRAVAYLVTDDPRELGSVLSPGQARSAIDYATADGATGRLIVDSEATLLCQPPELAERIEAIAALRRMLDWLEDHPDLPVGDLSLMHFPRAYHLAHDADGDLETEQAIEVAEVNRLAALMGVTPTHDTHYKAVKTFGRHGVYEVLTCNIPAEIVQQVAQQTTHTPATDADAGQASTG